MENKKIFAAIPKIMSEVGAIGKNRDNKMQGYSFRGIDDVYNALQGPLAKHGVFYAPKVLDQVREERQTAKGGLLIYTILKVEFTFFADDSSSFSVQTIGEAMDSGDKSANKAMSAALKYALLQVFCIPTDEPKDTENETHQPLPKGPAIAPKPVAPVTPAQAPAPRAPGQPYRCDFGKKYPGMTLEEISNQDGIDGLANYVNFLEKSAAEKNKPIDPASKLGVFIKEAADFIASFENSVMEPAPGDDIPF